MKKIVTVTIIGILLFAMLLPNGDAEAKLKDINKSLDLTAESAVVYCNTTEETVAYKNGDLRVNPYSITKLMTALLIIENHSDLSETVTISKEASEQEGSSMDLQEGEEISVEELLYGLLILSGNDAAYALAEYDSDIDTFANKMNEKAKQLGCKDTHFVNPSGLKDDDHYTTANDFIKIANTALDNKTIEKITGTTEYKMRATNKQDERVFKTHLDQLEDEDSGVISGKTGFWDDDDCSIAVRFKKRNLILTVVLLQDEKSERENDANEAFEFSELKLKSVKALGKDKPVKRIWIKNGKHTFIEVYAKDDSVVYPKDGEKSSTRIKVVTDKNIKAPLKSGEVIGKARIYSDGKYVESVPVYVKDSVETGWIFSMIYISNTGAICLIIAIALILDIVIIMKSGRKTNS